MPQEPPLENKTTQPPKHNQATDGARRAPSRNWLVTSCGEGSEPQDPPRANKAIQPLKHNQVTDGARACFEFRVSLTIHKELRVRANLSSQTQVVRYFLDMRP